MNQTELGNICKLRNGYAFKSDDFINDGIPIVRIGDINNGNINLDSTIKVKEKDLFNSFLIQKGAILIAMSGATTGKIGKYSFDTKAYQNQRVGCFIPDNDKINNEYLYCFLKTLKDKILQKAYGGGQPNISPKDIESLRIPLPPLDDQIRIADVLTRTEKLIAKRKESISALDEFLKSTFLEMFGDPVRNEKGWKTYSGNDYSDLLTVGVVIRPASYYTDKGIIALRSLNIKPNRIDLNNLVYFSEESSNGVLSKSILREGDVVIVRTGVTGTAAVVPKELDGVNCIDLIIVRPKKDMLNPYYLAFLLNSDRGKRLVTSKEVGGIQKHFNIGAIKDISFPFPPVALQNKFADIVAKVEAMKVKYNESLVEMEKLYGGLSQRAFRGEL
jgi:type I restriction enzyme S subunit